MPRKVAPAVAAVFTLDRVSKVLGEDEDLLYAIACDMTPEEGCINVNGLGNAFTVAFTDDGIDRLQLIPLYKPKH